MTEFRPKNKMSSHLITCQTCQLKYTGQTCDAFQKRWNN